MLTTVIAAVATVVAPLRISGPTVGTRLRGPPGLRCRPNFRSPSDPIAIAERRRRAPIRASSFLPFLVGPTCRLGSAGGSNK